MKNKKLPIFSAAVIFVTIISLSASGTFNRLAVTQEKDPMMESFEYLASLKNNQITGTIDPADILAAEQMSLKAQKSGLGVDWVMAGPDNFAGRTRAILYDKRDNQYNTIYAATTSGGIWKSTTGGSLWDPIPGTESIMNVTSMVQDNEGRIYVATGEAFHVYQFAAFPGFMGTGIYVSNSGDTFQRLESTAPPVNDSTSSWAYVNKLAYNPINNQKLFAATEHGLKYTTDGGSTWQFAHDKNGASLSGASTDVRVGTTGLTITAINNVPYMSLDGNPQNFDTITTGANGLPRTGVIRWEFAISPTNPDFIYAVAARSTAPIGQLLNVYQSRNKGLTWRIIGPGGSTFFNVFGADNVGAYANFLLVHPADEKIVFIGGKSMWRGTQVQDEGFFQWENLNFGAVGYANSNHHIYAFKPDNPSTVMVGTDRGIFSSTNNQTTFQRRSKNYATTQSYTVAISGSSRLLTGTQANSVLYISGTGNTVSEAEQIHTSFNGAYVEQSLIHSRAFIYSAPNAASGAIPAFRSDDLGQNVSLFDFIPSRITNGGVFLTPMLHWENTNYPFSRDSVKYYAETTIPAGTEIWVRSVNNRYPFRYTVTTTLNEGDSLMVKDPVASRFLLGVRNAVHITKEAIVFTKEPEWFRIAEVVGVPSALAISKDGNHAWVGNTNGKVYRIGNLNNAYDSLTYSVGSPGYVLNVIEAADYANRIVTSISVDPRNSNHVIITLGNYGNNTYVYRSTNATSAEPTFTSVQGNLPPMPVYSSLIEMNNSNIVILGTEYGIWTTDNIGNPNWAQESGGMGNVAVFQMKQQTTQMAAVTVPIDTLTSETYPGVDNYGVIYAATFGRGLFKTTRFVGINELPDKPFTNARTTNLQLYPNPASDVLYIDYQSVNNEAVTITIYDMNGRSIITTNFGALSAGNHTLQFDISRLPKGVYFVRLDNAQRILSNKLIVK